MLIFASLMLMSLHTTLAMPSSNVPAIERVENMDRAVNVPDGFLPVYVDTYHSCGPDHKLAKFLLSVKMPVGHIGLLVGDPAGSETEKQQYHFLLDSKWHSAYFGSPYKRRFVCFTEKSFSDIYDVANTVTEGFGSYHPSRKSCNDGAAWLLRELCHGAQGLDGHTMTRDETPVPKSSMRLKKFMEVTTAKQFHRYWDGVMRKADYNPVILSRQRFYEGAAYPPHIQREPGSEEALWFKWINDDGDMAYLPKRKGKDSDGSIAGSSDVATLGNPDDDVVVAAL